MSLTSTPIRVPILGIDGKSDAKNSMAGKLDLLENGFVVKESEGGYEVRKRNGVVSLSRSIDGGGALAAGSKLAAYGDELIATDGLLLYAWSPNLGKWVTKGKCTSVSAQIDKIASNISGTATQVDMAVANGLACIVNRTGIYYVLEIATGTTIVQGNIGSENRMRVVAVGNDFYIFSVVGSVLRARKITGTTPTVIGGAVAVSAASAGSVFDVCVDVGNARMVVCFRDTALNQTTLCIWTTAMAIGTSVNYVTRNPDTGISFLTHDFSDGNGYVGIGTSATGVRVLTFGRSSMVVGTDTLIDAAVTVSTSITGWVSGVSGRNVYYDVPGAAAVNRKINGWTNASGVFLAAGSAGLGSRAFKVASKWYFTAIFSTSAQGHSYLLEADDGAGGANGCISIAGYLMAGNAAGVPGFNIISSAPALSATKVFIGGTTIDSGATSIVGMTLSWGDDFLGEAVAFNGVLNIPGACGKVYDGQAVYEHGFVAWPEAPTLTQGAGGALTLLATYSYAVVWSVLDDSGRLWESTTGFFATTTLTGANNRITVDVPQYRITERATSRNIGKVVAVNVKLYRTQGNSKPMQLVTTQTNDVSVDTQSFVDNVADTTLATAEFLYSDGGTLKNVTPPAVLCYRPHRGRMFAACGDGAVWGTKDVVDGLAVGFSSAIRLPFDPGEGPLVGLISLDSVLAVGKRSKFYAITGDGPDLAGNNPYPYPTPLPGAEGLIAPRAFCLTPAGGLVKTAKGWRLLDRGGSVQPVIGAEAYDAMTVTGGVSFDDQSFACMVTSDGTILVRDWTFNQWFPWTGLAAVSCCRWKNQFVILASDGTAKVMTAGVWGDDGAAITHKVRFDWLHLATLLGFSRVWEIQTLADFMSTFTLTMRLAVNFNPAIVQAVTKACTAATISPLSTKPLIQEFNALQITYEETSTTEGFRLSSLVLEAGFEPRGLKPLATGQAMT